MRDKKGEMSPSAKRIFELAGGFVKRDVSHILRDHPELISGLDEYLAHRDNENRMIGETKSVLPKGHIIRNLIADLRKRKTK